MFKIAPEPTFWSPVRITVPGEEEPAQIEVEFRHKSVTALREFIDEARSRPDVDTVADIVRNWRGVDVPFARDALATLLENYPAAAAELFGQYVRALTESRAKN